MVLNAAAQAMKEADELKKKILEGCNAPVPTAARTLLLTQLQKAYQKVLLIDLDYALDKKVEQELWNVGFKHQIELLQNNMKDKKNPRRSENQTLLLWVLQAATGFYICLLHSICTTFKVNLPFRCNIPYPGRNTPYIQFRPPQSASCWYICQHCLVHLGDLARYSRQPKRADSFYRQALTVSPRNGQPYNQLGLLHAAKGDRLGAAYYHARGVAVGGPFPPAANNLIKTLAGSIERGRSPEPHLPSVLSPNLRLSSEAYTGSYLVFHHRLQAVEGLEQARCVLQGLTSTLTGLVATDAFSAGTIIKMCCLDLYAIYSVTDGHKLEESSLTNDERKVLELGLELIAGALAALLLPAHTRAADEMLTYPALPAVKILMEWVKIHPSMLKGTAFTSRLQLWPGLCTLLNSLQQIIGDFSGKEYEMVPLPEDKELQGFLPIDEALTNLKFLDSSPGNTLDLLPTLDNIEGTSIKEILAKRKSDQLLYSDLESLKNNTNFMDSLRAYRLILLGEWLVNHMRENGAEYISICEKDGIKVFAPVQNCLENNSDLMKAIEELSLLREKKLSESAEHDSETNTVGDHDETLADGDDKTGQLFNVAKGHDEDDIPIVISESDFKERVLEKRAGILKPQGSLERARGEKAISLTPETHSGDLSVTPDGVENQDTGSSCSTVSQDGNTCSDVGSLLEPPLVVKGKRSRTNVALQAIMRKQEESSKQVKFLTPVTTPDSIGEPNQLSPLGSKEQVEKKKILQPKVIKSLASIPTDRKTGGILSLKDKSAGYPHLVNTEPVDVPCVVDDVKVAKDSAKHLNVARQHAEISKHSPGKTPEANQGKTDKDFEATSTPATVYPAWSDGTSTIRPHFNIVRKDKDSQFGNAGSLIKPMNFSYFSDAQNTSITLPVVNPKEIDIRSVALQRQKSLNASNEPSIDQHNKEHYNHWVGMSPYQNQHSPAQREQMARNPSLPPRLANLKKNKINPDFNRMQENSGNYRFQEGNIVTQQNPSAQPWNANSQQPQTNWWKPGAQEANYDSQYQQQNAGISHNYSSYYRNSPQHNASTGPSYPDQGNYSYAQQNQNVEQNFGDSSPGSSRYNANASYPAPNQNYQGNQSFSPYSPFSQGMYPQFSSKFGFSTQPVSKAQDYCLSPYPKASQFGLAQSSTQPMNEAMLNHYLSSMPEFVPRKNLEDGKGYETKDKRQDNSDLYKQTKPSQLDSPGSSANSYSLFSGGQELSWGSPSSIPPISPHQSLWSGPGPSPLERLLEQQKQFKYPPNE